MQDYKEAIINNYIIIFKLIKNNNKFSESITKEHKKHNAIYKENFLQNNRIYLIEKCRECSVESAKNNLVNALKI